MLLAASNSIVSRISQIDTETRRDGVLSQRED